jgi:hypothetical protein
MSIPKGSLVLLLGPGTSLAEFERIADRSGWPLFRVEKGDQDTAYEQIRVTPDRSTAIQYVADPTPKERFLVAYGPLVDSIAYDLGRLFDVETPGEVLERARSAVSDDEKLAAAYQLGVVYPEYNAEVMTTLSAFYQRGSAEVRSAVINGLGYASWGEARPFLESAAHNDPDPELRQNAKCIVDALWPPAAGDKPNP